MIVAITIVPMPVINGPVFISMPVIAGIIDRSRLRDHDRRWVACHGRRSADLGRARNYDRGRWGSHHDWGRLMAMIIADGNAD